MMGIEVEVTVRVYLRGVDLDPDLVTSALNMVPDRTQKKGTPLSPRHPDKLSKFGLWVWKIDLDSTVDVLASSLGRLVQSVTDLGRPINTIEGVEEAWVDVHCIQEIEPDGSGVPDVELCLTNSEVALLRDMGLPLSITVSSISRP